MIDFYTIDDFNKIKKQRNNTILIYAFILGLYVLLSAGFITWVALLPLESSKTALAVWLHHITSIIFIAVTFIFFGIPFKRVNKFYKVCDNFNKGLKKTDTGVFLRFEDELLSKDGVDCKTLVFEEKNKFKNSTIERKIQIFYEKDYPDIKEGQKLEYITQANFLLKYKVLPEEDK